MKNNYNFNGANKNNLFLMEFFDENSIQKHNIVGQCIPEHTAQTSCRWKTRLNNAMHQVEEVCAGSHLVHAYMCACKRT